MNEAKKSSSLSGTASRRVRSSTQQVSLIVLQLLCLSSLFQPSWSFIPQSRSSRPLSQSLWLNRLSRNPTTRSGAAVIDKASSLSSSSLSSSSLSSSSSANNVNTNESTDNSRSATNTNSLEIVLFGTGDLRTTDHGGLSKAMTTVASSTSNPNHKILPLFIMDTKDTIPNIPMGRTHLVDNASILHASLVSLQKQLKTKYGLDLHVCVGEDENEGVVECINRVIQTVTSVHGGTNTNNNNNDDQKSDNDVFSNITIHSCDLGHVDNHLAYGPFQHLTSNIDSVISTVQVEDDNSSINIDINIEKWDCSLREQPWNDVSMNHGTFPSLFPDYQKKYNIESVTEESLANVNQVYKVSIDQSTTLTTESLGLSIPSMINTIPSVEEISNLLCKALDLEKGDMQNQINTGLYATHWGGLDVLSTMDEEVCLRAVDIFLNDDTVFASADGGDGGDEALVDTLRWWSSNSNECKLKLNPKSLEHASMNWLMTGGKKNEGEGESNISAAATTTPVKTKSLIEGELLTRYLAAPLLFGTVSPRYLWQKSEEVRKKKESPFDIFGKATANTQLVKEMVEKREWHKLFGAKSSYSITGESYGYLRWHGFLCRYLSKTSAKEKGERDGVVLVHGFGASGSQWEKTIAELEKLDGGDRGIDALAPDLIGFGQSEKPSLSYSQYLWEGYTADCVKEVGLGTKNWRSFVIGGNSIGGYTAMGAVADDSRTASDDNDVSAFGTSGTGKAKGLVLMNSAGRILSRDEINESESTIAETTSLGMLGENSPPPRTLTKAGGNGLLWYLRPRIQSICKNLYPTNPNAVNDNLCEGILRDSLDPGAINVMISGSKLPPPRTANELLGADFGSFKSKGSSRVRERSFDGPVLVAQGILDPLNDAQGRANMLEQLRPGITISKMNAGHCPHDELPETTAEFISAWMKTSMSRI